MLTPAFMNRTFRDFMADFNSPLACDVTINWLTPPSGVTLDPVYKDSVGYNWTTHSTTARCLVKPFKVFGSPMEGKGEMGDILPGDIILILPASVDLKGTTLAPVDKVTIDIGNVLDGTKTRFHPAYPPPASAMAYMTQMMSNNPMVQVLYCRYVKGVQP